MKKSPFFDTQNNTNPNQHNVNHNNTSLPSIPTHSSQLPSAYSLQQQQQYFAAYAAQQQYRLQQQASRQRKLSQSRNNNTLTKPSSTINKNNNSIYSQRYLLDLMGNANMNGTATQQQYYTNNTDNPPQPQPQPQSHIVMTQQPESTINLTQNPRHSPSTKILEYDDVLSEMRPTDLMQFDEEWTHEFPKQNSIEATNWFTKAADIWKVVDDDRLKRNVHNGYDNMLYSDGDKNEKLATPTNQHHDHHQSDSDHAQDSDIEPLKAKKTRKKSKTKSRSKKKKKKKSKKSHSSLSSSSSSAKKTAKKSKKSRKKKKKKKSKKSKKKKKKSKKKQVKTPKKRGRKKGQTKKKMLEMSQQNEDRKRTKTMWIYKKILDPMIDDIYWEKLPCPARQNDFKHLQPDELLPNCFDTTPPTPTWLHHFVYNDIANNNNHENSNNVAPKQEKTLQDEWIGDALMIYDFLFRFKKLLRMNDTFTISEWIDCVRRKHETYLMNFVLSIFVAIIMNKSELKMKERSELLNGYKCSLLTWPSLLLDFLNIRKRNMLVDDRTKQYAFNDIIKVINRNKPSVDVNDDNDNNAKSTPFFNEISCDRKIELLTMMMHHIVGETKLFKYEFQTLINEMDKYRQQYLQHRDEECKRVRADAKNEDKVMRGLHRSIPVHWTDFDIICKANQRNESMSEDFMEQFYGKFFHSMSLEGANKGKVSKTEIEKYKTKLFVLIKLKNELQKAGEITDCPQPINLSKTDPQSKVIKENWRGKVQANVEKIFNKYINDFVIVPETKIFAQNRKEMVHVMVLNYNKTSALSLGLDRYNNRYWILADDFSKIIVENTDENQWGYFDKNAQLQELILFLNDSGRNEATLKINLLEKGINYRVDNSVSTEWNLTAWLSDNRHSQWICYPNWRYVLRYQIQQTNFYQFISKDSSKNAAYQQIMLGRNNNNGNDMNDNVPFQMSVIKHFLLDLQWSLHLCCSEESLKAREVFRRDLQNEYVSIHKLAEFAWRLFRSIDGLWRKKWLNVKALKQKLMQNDDENPRTYSKIMLCLYVIDAAIFYQESEYLTQNKNNTNKRRSKLEERMMKLQVDYNKNNFDAKEKHKSQLLCDVNMSFSANAPKKRGRKPNSLNKHKTVNTPTAIKRGRIVQKEEKKNYDLESSQSDSNSSSNSHASDSELESSSDSSAASSDSLPPRKKTKRGRPRKNAILETLKNNTKIKTKSKSKRYTGARTNLTLICSKCVLAEDQNAIIKCSSCHGGYHTYCMEDETSWDPKNNDGEFFCHECIGAQISHLSTRRSHRLQKKSPSKSLTKSPVKNNKNEIDEFQSISEFEKAQFEKSASDQESGHEEEEEDENEYGIINRKRKRKINNRFEDTSSEDGNDDILNEEPSTKKRKLRANENGNDNNQSINKINNNDLRIPKRTTITKRSDNNHNNNRNKYELPKFNITNNINVNQTNINQIMVNNNINNQNENKQKQSQPSQQRSKSSKSSYSNSRSANKKYESYSSSSHSSTSHSRHRNDRNYKYGGHNDGEYRRSGTRNMERNIDTKYDSYHHRESRERHNKYRDRDRSYKHKHKHRDRDRDRERSSHRRDRDRDNRDNKDRNRIKRYQRRRDHTNNNNNNQRSRHRKCNNYYTYSSDDNDDINDSDYRP